LHLSEDTRPLDDHEQSPGVELEPLSHLTHIRDELVGPWRAAQTQVDKLGRVASQVCGECCIVEALGAGELFE
jgi:hypothetical protein